MKIAEYGNFSIHKTVDEDYGNVTFFEVRDQYGNKQIEFDTRVMSHSEAEHLANVNARYLNQGILEAR